MENLKRGTWGQHVLDLQCSLAAAGVLSGNLDGSFGPSTEVAVRAFQSTQSLPVTGVADERTAQALQVRWTTPAAGLEGLGLEGLSPTAGLSPFSGLSPESVARVFPQARALDLALNLPHVLTALAGVGLTSRELVAAALATIRTEACLFLPVSELPSAFNTSVGGKPFDLYDTRAALGNRGAPDGATYRGRGFIQLTGRVNYRASGHAIGLGDQLVQNPLLAHDPAISGKILASFLHARQTRLRTALAQGDLAAARRVVNGGTSGLATFAAAYQTLLSLLPTGPAPVVAQRVA